MTDVLSGSQKWVRGIIPDAVNRPRDDFYPTPPSATEALLAVEDFSGLVWEPACGDGAITRVLQARGLEVVSSDLIDRGFGQVGVDFLLDYRTRADCIVTNPPFKLAEPFIRHALGRVPGKVAMFLRLAFLEGIARRRLFQGTPIARVWVFSSRVALARNGEAMANGGMIAFAWFVWDPAHAGPPVLGWLP
ncbi:hypothetical protein EDC65_2265 [Stella humosa]|uniref:Uncharacterized protein n=1 Tax=Stella humosa TaxID=94 RepID=A0A3N1MH28_9PROT|nr:hypothetical protein [Stella humosa]ROQ00466.1 hypothetical protein EDC65_2265 [Stella humosa]BBK30289.1 hypothetical protein STHU_09230 [Stella humosa]